MLPITAFNYLYLGKMRQFYILCLELDQLIRETAEGVCEPTLGPPLDAEQKSVSSMGTPSQGAPVVRGQSVP